MKSVLVLDEGKHLRIDQTVQIRFSFRIFKRPASVMTRAVQLRRCVRSQAEKILYIDGPQAYVTNPRHYMLWFATPS
jgi:hypothetical protein